MALNFSCVQEQTEPVKQGTSENKSKNYVDTHPQPDSYAKLVFMHAASTSNFSSRWAITVISFLRESYTKFRPTEKINGKN